MSEEKRPERRLLDAGRATRTMRWVMAIMLFLTVLAAALGLGALAASRALDRQLAGRLTIELVEPNPIARDHDAAQVLAMARGDRNVAAARPVDPARLAKLLQPWLGAIGNDPDLPMPVLIDLDLHDASDLAVAALARRIHAIVPAARLDRHAAWMAPVTGFMNLLLGLAAGIVLLLALATGTVVVLAARAGLETHRDTIEIMHMLGSTDVQVARLFQRRIARDTAIGGAVGGIAALAVTALVGTRLAGLGSALASGATLGPGGWIALAAIPFLFVGLATLAARIAVLRTLGAKL
ncbi:cell division protein FtsX [Hephaestia mangrovi]|uniref:cell division protein FtsX n=1 Tax=Hephaestia mangrovi TaxID=2873268 RepID=UPI001CA659AD|nr:FtsX-like permease family protein [Hephaestia mangrovi]MBY8829581.1 permease [Hephaestia mangrovi]